MNHQPLRLAPALALLCFLALLPAIAAPAAADATGCPSPTTDPALAAPSLAQDKPATEETVVYFIRRKAFYGAARKAWLACNDGVVATLASGHYCRFPLKAGANTLNLVQDKAPVGFYFIKNRPGETIYLAYDYATGSIIELPQGQGTLLVQQSQETPLLPQIRTNDGYEFGTINPGFFTNDFMRISRDADHPDSEKAVVTFIRPGDLIAAVPFGIWNEDGYLGNLSGKNYLQVRMKPGKHIFWGKSERFSIVQAEVEAGKQYFVLFEVGMGMYLANIKLSPVKSTLPEKTLQKWLRRSEHVTLDRSRIDKEFGLLLGKRAAPIIELVHRQVEKSEIEALKLLPGDAR